MMCLPPKKKLPSLYLDEDLWGEILKRLPVEVLLRCRCVCTSWKSLISSPTFIRDQYLSSSNSVLNKTFILFDTHVECADYYALYNPDQFSPSEPQLRIGFQRIPFRGIFTVVTDVIHGVVCLSLSDYPYVHDIPVSGYTILWNPATRTSVEIPRRDATLDVGFGFDGRKNDFKVVRTDEDREKPNTLEVYSYREGRSRTVDSDQIGPFNLVSRRDYRGYSNCNCLKNGAIHWIIRRRQNCSRLAILVFDCESEELKTMELPQRFNEPGLTVEIRRLFVQFGKVSVLETTRTKGDKKGETALWVMDEYGVATSWKKTAYDNKDFTIISRRHILTFVDGWPTNNEAVKRSQPPWNGHVFEPSLLLMDEESVTTTAPVHIGHGIGRKKSSIKVLV